MKKQTRKQDIIEHAKVMFPRTKAGNDALKAVIKLARNQGRLEFQGDLLKKDNHILGCMLECYVNILEYRGFNKEAKELEEIASKLK